MEDQKNMHLCMYVCMYGFYYTLRAVHYLRGTTSIHALAEMYGVVCILTMCSNSAKYSLYMTSVPIPH